MKPEELKPFVDFMKTHGLLILSLEKPDFKLYLAREGAEKIVSAAAPAASVRFSAAGTAPETPSETPAAQNAATVTSPLVGTFYQAPAPGSPPFVEAGQEVKAGDTVCIVEAMKVMNEVKTEVSGKVLEVKAENGKPVEFGQVLFLIEKPKP